MGPIRLGSEKVWVRVVPEILGPNRLGSELSDIHSNDATCAVVRVLSIPLHAKADCRPSISTVVSCLGRQQNH